MKRLTATEVHARKVAELGLDAAALDLTSIEAIAGALRRSASFLCPCAPTTLVRGVVQPLRGLVDGPEGETKELVEHVLEALIAHGDILEHREVGEDVTRGARTLLYAAPASFVSRQSGAVLLLGVASDQLSALPDDLEARIEYAAHVRRISPLAGEDLQSELAELGLIALSTSDWLRAPPPESFAEQLSRFDQLLDLAVPSREIPGLSLLDPEQSVRYYPGRWAEPRSRSGRFVARRSQAYGADLWCYVQLREGHPERLIDLPPQGSQWRGCDEAWRLQMAIDARRGTPQRFRVRPGPGGSHVLELFSPVPAWARRRWDAVAEPVLSSGCLFAYRLSGGELEEELRFVQEGLWLKELAESGLSR